MAKKKSWHIVQHLKKVFAEKYPDSIDIITLIGNEEANIQNIIKPPKKADNYAGTYGRLRKVFEDVYANENQDLRYYWTSKDAKAIVSLTAKMVDILNQRKEVVDDERLSVFFKQFLEHLPEWEKKNMFNPSTLNNNFSSIIAKIIREHGNAPKQQGTSRFSAEFKSGI